MILRRLVLTAVLAAALPTAVAAAAASVSPSTGYYNSGGEGGGSFAFNGTKIGKNALAPSKFKCNSTNAVIPKAIRVKANAFRYAGKLKGQPGRIVFKGHWKTSTTVVGTATITNGACSSKTSFTATYAGPARPYTGPVSLG